MSTPLYNRAQRSILALRDDVAKLLSGEDTSAGQQGKITTALSGIQRQIRDLEDTAKREMDPEKRLKTKEQVKKVTAECREVKLAFDGFKTKQEEAQRESLFAHNQYAAAANPTVNLYQPNAPHAFSGLPTVQERKMGHVDSQLSDYVNQGMAFIDSMREQRSVMKGARTRMLNAATTLGLSHETIRWAERRIQEDKWIFWAGVAVTCVAMYFVFAYLL